MPHCHKDGNPSPAIKSRDQSVHQPRNGMPLYHATGWQWTLLIRDPDCPVASPYANPNVRWLLWGGFFQAIAISIFRFSPTWLVYSLGGSNTDLGLIMGPAILLAIGLSVGASRIADRNRTDQMLWMGSLLALLGGLILSRARSLELIFIGVVVAQTGFLTLRASTTALLSNSISSEARNRIFGTQFLMNTTGWAIASLILYVIYQGQGTVIEELDSDLIRLSLLVGAVFATVGVLLNFMVRDRQTLREEDEGSVASDHDHSRRSEVEPEYRGRESLRDRFAPGALPIIIISLGALVIVGFGAGTSVPYFPRFFFDVYGLDLSELSLAFAALTVATAIWGKVTANLADRFGRVEVIVANQAVAVLLLYSLAAYPPFWLALSTLLLRNALMNGAWPVQNSLQMEYTPRRYRSQISALSQNCFQVTFAIGQINGGMVIDGPGFRYAFIITASTYLVATMLVWRVKRLMLKAEKARGTPPARKGASLLNLASK